MKRIDIKTLILLLAICMAGCFCLRAQSKNNNFISSDCFFNFLPACPEHILLGSFGNFPVNYYTGLPEANVDLMTLTSGDISLPGSLNYDATGVKLNDRLGTVDLKRNPNIEGFIVRQPKWLAG